MKVLKKKQGDVRAFWEAANSTPLSLAWLGQAGFAIRAGNLRLVIDPYLSDCLEKKYRGTEKPHNRLMLAPITPAELSGLDAVLCTHKHSDHMDPEALPQIAAAQTQAQFFVPKAEREHAIRLGLPAARTISIDAGETISLSADCSLRAIPSAHETLETNQRGEYRYLGFLIQLGDVTIYHSGDTVPYPELVNILSSSVIDLALLPVNGRGHGVAGNFTFHEAIALCRDAGIPYMIPQHFGMFAFNTVEQEDLQRWIATISSPKCHLPTAENWFEIHSGTRCT